MSGERKVSRALPASCRRNGDRRGDGPSGTQSGIAAMSGRRGGDKLAWRRKSTRDLKAMILVALDDAGGQQYLAEQARANPAAFMTLLGTSALSGHRYPTSWTKHERARLAGSP